MQTLRLVTLVLLPLVLASPIIAQVATPELVVTKSAFRIDVVVGDSVLKSYSVALGKNTGDKQRLGDHRTPEGKFSIVQIQRSGSWKHDFGDGKGEIAGAYGPWFLRFGSGETRMKWTGIGIHGTHDPASIGTLASEGCIRMKNEDLEELRRLVKVGMKVTVAP